MRKPQLESGLIYHVFNRGVSKQKIFLEDNDYRFFIYKIGLLKKKYCVKTVVYCLMPNHYHFALYTKDKPEKISKYMKALQLSFAHHFNKKYKHSGHVFQGRFHNKHVNNLEKIIEYIKQNPVKHGFVKKAENWPYQG